MVTELHAMRIVCLLKAATPAWDFSLNLFMSNYFSHSSHSVAFKQMCVEFQQFLLV